MKLRLIPYDSAFDAQIDAIEPEDLAEIRRNGDVFPESVKLALYGKKCIGVGYLTLGTVNDGILTVNCTFDVNSSNRHAVGAAKALLEAQEACFEALKEKLPVRPVRLSVFAKEDSTVADFVREEGFLTGRKMTVFRNDLSTAEDVCTETEVTLADGIVRQARIGFLDVTDPDSMARYLKANGKGFGCPDSEKSLLFRVEHWRARVYAWMCEGEVLSAVTVWPQRQIAFATEDVFCVPEARRQGLTGKLLRYVLKMGKDKGYAQADLNAFSHNETAIRLYEKCGYAFLRDMEYGKYLKKTI